MAKVKKAGKAKLQKAARGGGKPAARSAKSSGKPAGKVAAKRASSRAAPAPPRGGAKKVSHVPAGYHAVTPTLSIADCAKAIEFYKEALGAKETYRMAAPDGKTVMYAELRIGDSPIMLSDPVDPRVKPPSREAPSGIGIWLYVPDCDALFEQATKAGATVMMPVADMFWGDRFGKLLDPFGVLWGIATHVKDPSDAEIRQGSEEFATRIAQGAGQGAAQGNASGSTEAPAA